MKHIPLAAALAAGMIVLPLIVVSVPASAYHPIDHPVFSYHPPGKFSIKPGERKLVIDVLSDRHYRICNDGTSLADLTVHYRDKKTSLLQPGECHDFETKKLEVENLSGEPVSIHGSFHQLGPPHPRP